ncbi:MAG TPA: hypothetical protein VKY19_07085 [Ktedonosporobacter sp.]|nr:hypothetical protein [Ktedonosporobacter sp.]
MAAVPSVGTTFMPSDLSPWGRRGAKADGINRVPTGRGAAGRMGRCRHRATARDCPSPSIPALGKVIGGGQDNRKGLPLPIHCRPPANGSQWGQGNPTGLAR